jgi:hypothetical protein
MTQSKKSPAKGIKSPTPAQPVKPTEASPTRMILIAMAVTFVCYLGALKCGFVNWDDDATILNNPILAKIDAQHLAAIFDIQQGSAQLGNYNPLAIFSFFIEKAVAGSFNATLVHFDNILLHALVVMLVMRVLIAMGFGMGGAFVGGLFFGIHPMRVESVREKLRQSLSEIPR